MSNEIENSDSDLPHNPSHLARRSKVAKNAEDVKDKDRRNKMLRRVASNGANPLVPREMLDTALDDSHIMSQSEQGVIFGAYGPDEWITSSYVREAVANKKNTIVREGTWVTPAGWELVNWVPAKSERFNFMSTHRALMFMSWGMIEASYSRNKIFLELNGEQVALDAFVQELDTELKRAENLIEWIYGSRGESISVPLNYRPALNAAYPWLPCKLESYIDSYLNATSSVLILIGEPGTGKTTFIKNLIHRSGGDAKVTYDEKIMSGDGLFANFIESDTKFMIMEDADAFLAKREDGNTMMHRFLNVSDGLISARDKKLVFSTNLPSVREIDAALMRPGRCFDIVEFRKLTRVEAQAVAKEANVELPDGSEFTLAEVFNDQPSGEAQSLNRSIGFR